jgi:hypothetical protein
MHANRCPKCGHAMGNITLSTPFLRYITVALFMVVLAFFSCVTWLLATGKL